jgi:hypothetical protein
VKIEIESDVPITPSSLVDCQVTNPIAGISASVFNLNLFVIVIIFRDLQISSRYNLKILHSAILIL